MDDSLPPKVAELLAGYPVIITQPVVWGDMDAYQHVNNTVYFRYFENARLEYFRRLDWFTFERETGIGPILQATHARFRIALAYPDSVSIGARLTSIEEDRFHLEHAIVSHRLQEVAAVGEGTVVSFHYNEQRKVELPEVIRERILRLEAE